MPSVSRLPHRPLLALCLFAAAAPAAKAAVATDLLFSEYLEGSSNNKAIEIYNGTGADVNLSGYTIELYTNGGSTTPTSTLTLSGTLANGDVYVIRNSGAALQAIIDAADVSSGVANFNGDDALLLKKSGTVIDRFGQFGNDPGTEWGTGLTSTADNTLVRKPTICAGDTASTAAFDPSVQWDGFAVDTAGNLGSHNANCPPRLTVSNVAVTEGDTGTATASFSVTLSNEAGAALTVDYATADGTATVADGDYVAARGQLSFTGTAGQSLQVNVTVNGDMVSEGNETFRLVLSNPSLAGTVLGQGTATISNDDIVPPALSAADVAIAEGNGGTSTLSFTVLLDKPAASGGASVAYTTADVSATAGSDYVAASGTLNFAAGETQKTVEITINGDTAVEPSETFELRFATPNGLTIADATAVGTITADDLATISQIQGNGAASPVVGQFTLTRGIVTQRVSNGFYIQSQQADTDADPTTSEGLFVFTGGAPSATDVVVGNLLEVSGTVAEFVPGDDPNQQGQTQLGSPILRVLSTGNTLPTPVALDASLPDPLGSITQLERLENVRVSVAALSVTAPTDGSVNETSATATGNGRFSGVVSGVARPFREPGLEPEDAVGRPLDVPRFDGNPERLAIDSRRARDTANVQRAGIDVDVGAELGGVVGVLDYAFRSWRISLDFAAAPTVSGGRAPAAVAAAGPTEYSIATYNLERFFDASNDPAISEPVLSANAFTTRLAKASLAVRDFLGTPDILGAVEVENLATLQALATRINDDAVAARTAGTC
jgi:predicted extracellular nuclease